MSLVEFVDDPILVELDLFLILFVISLVLVVVDGEQAFFQIFFMMCVLSYFISLLLMYLAMISGKVL